MIIDKTLPKSLNSNRPKNDKSENFKDLSSVVDNDEDRPMINESSTVKMKANNTLKMQDKQDLTHMTQMSQYESEKDNMLAPNLKADKMQFGESVRKAIVRDIKCNKKCHF